MESSTSSIGNHWLRKLDTQPVLAWLCFSLVYGLLWLGFLQVSQILWFLPAGLRLASLWVLPARRWGWVLLGEAMVAFYLTLTTDASLLDPHFVALSFAPLLIYALVMYFIRGPTPGPIANTPRNMLLLLFCGFIAAVLASPVLSFFYEHKSLSELHFEPNTWGGFFAFVYGDLIGQLILGSLLIPFFDNSAGSLKDRHLWLTVLLASVVTGLFLLLLHVRANLAPFLLLLIFVPMFIVAFRKAAKGAAFSVAATGVLLEIYLQFNPLPLDLMILQLAFALLAACSLMLGAAMSALRDNHLGLQLQHQHVAMMNTQLLHTSEVLRHVSQRLVRLEEQGQRALADELDVELGQSLHTLSTHLAMAVRTVKEPETMQTLFVIRDKAREMDDSLRRVLRQLRPKALDNKGLKEAINNGPLHELLDDSGVALETQFIGDTKRLHEDEKTAIYRICQTITQQTIKLSGIKKLCIRLELKADASGNDRALLQLELNPIAVMPKTSLVLQAVQDRVLALDGEYEVQTQDQSLVHKIAFQQKQSKPD
jgi:glucose-6-phosphate-specific signal transduction histidine kinase